MAYAPSSPRERGMSAAVAVIGTATLGWLLVAGLAVTRHGGEVPALAVFEVAPPPRPEPARTPAPRQAKAPRKSGEASPPNLRANPTEVVAPPPQQPPAVPPPLPAAPIAGTGSAPSAGAAEVAGPGTGAGGVGNGRGSGGWGDGDGGGGGEETAPEQIRGDIRDRDYPRAAADAGAGGTVGVRYVVQANGRVGECRVTRSSGNDALDTTTCRLIRERFRFRPSRDAQGRAVAAVIVENHEWLLHTEEAVAEPEEKPRRRARIF